MDKNLVSMLQSMPTPIQIKQAAREGTQEVLMANGIIPPRVIEQDLDKTLACPVTQQEHQTNGPNADRGSIIDNHHMRLPKTGKTKANR